MKFNINIFAFIFFVGLVFSSCNKENFDTSDPIEDPEIIPSEIGVNNLALTMNSGTDDGLSLSCLQVNFPFDLTLEGDNKTTINTYNEYKEAINAPAPNRVVDIVYPVSGIDHNGEEAQFNNNAELGKSFISCVPNDGWVISKRSNATIPAFLLDFCFELVYPVNLQDGDGNGYTAENEAEFIDLCATNESLFFTLPLTVLDLDGNEIVFSDVDSFFVALAECEGISPPVVDNGIEIIGFGCNTIQYPFDVELEDGTLETITDEDEYATLLLSGVSMQLQYPFSLTTLEDETIIVNNFEDLIAAFADCGVIIEVGPLDPCDIDIHILLFFNQGFGTTGCGYDIAFPVQVIADGETVVLNDMLDYFDVFNNNMNIEMIYPVNTTLEDGSNSSFESDEEICAFISDCE